MRKGMTLALALAVAGVLGALAFSWERSMSPAERGKFLVKGLGCHGCHTPMIPGPGGWAVPDETRLLSGHPQNSPDPTPDVARRDAYIFTGRTRTAWAGSWGTSFAANLTPDKDTGLGDWTEDMFIRTIRTGRHQGRSDGREILPPMPWANLSHATLGSSDADLKAIWAYLRSLPPVKNRVPDPMPSTRQENWKHQIHTGGESSGL